MFSICESEAEPVVGCLFTAVKNDLCRILICIPTCASVCSILALYTRASVALSFYGIYHLCKLEQSLLSFPIFPVVKQVSKDILNSSTCTVVDVPQ